MSNNISDFSQRRNKAIASATELIERGLKTPEDKELHRKNLAEIDELQETIDMLSHIQRSLPPQRAQPASPSPIVHRAEPSEQRRAKLNGAWRSLLKGETYDQRNPEQRDILTSSGGADGGASVPQEMQTNFISTATKAYAPLAQYVRTNFSPNGRPKRVLKVDDRAQGLYLLTEGGTSNEEDAAFSTSLVNLDLLTTGITKFSIGLLDDGGFDLEQLLTTLASSRIGRGLERILTRGLDTGGSVTPNNPGILSIAQTAVTTNHLADGVSYQNLVSLFDSLDPSFLPNATWMVTSKTRTAMMSFTDSTGRPLLVPSPSFDGLYTLFGQPLIINQSLDQIGTANGVPIIFASLYDGIEMVSSEIRVTNLYERFVEQRLGGIIVTTRVGSTALAPGAIQALKLAAA